MLSGVIPKYALSIKISAPGGSEEIFIIPGTVVPARGVMVVTTVFNARDDGSAVTEVSETDVVTDVGVRVVPVVGVRVVTDEVVTVVTVVGEKEGVPEGV